MRACREIGIQRKSWNADNFRNPMRCPNCNTDNDKVVDSRSVEDGFSIRRRRECLRCERRFTTYERFEQSALRVVKKDGTRSPFDRRKVLGGILKACEKRPVSTQDMETIVMRVEQEIARKYDREVPSPAIGELVMKELKRLDPVAYVRFASVYREFKDVGDFVDDIRGMPKRRTKGRGRQGGKA